MSKSRTRATRRNRRKARASGWMRQPRKSSVIGHGTGMTFGHTSKQGGSGPIPGYFNETMQAVRRLAEEMR